MYLVRNSADEAKVSPSNVFWKAVRFSSASNTARAYYTIAAQQDVQQTIASAKQHLTTPLNVLRAGSQVCNATHVGFIHLPDAVYGYVEFSTADLENESRYALVVADENRVCFEFTYLQVCLRVAINSVKWH